MIDCFPDTRPGRISIGVGVAQAKPLLFQGLVAGKRGYLALEPHSPYRNSRHKAALALEE